jgi:hypothetical protein
VGSKLRGERYQVAVHDLGGDTRARVARRNPPEDGTAGGMITVVRGHSVRAELDTVKVAAGGSRRIDPRGRVAQVGRFGRDRSEESWTRRRSAGLRSRRSSADLLFEAYWRIVVVVTRPASWTTRGSSGRPRPRRPRLVATGTIALSESTRTSYSSLT